MTVPELAVLDASDEVLPDTCRDIDDLVRILGVAYLDSIFMELSLYTCAAIAETAVPPLNHAGFSPCHRVLQMLNKNISRVVLGRC
jgi:hypothetical protein